MTASPLGQEFPETSLPLSSLSPRVTKMRYRRCKMDCREKETFARQWIAGLVTWEPLRDILAHAQCLLHMRCGYLIHATATQEI